MPPVISATGRKASTPAQTATAVAALESRAPATSRFQMAWANAAASASATAPIGIRRLCQARGSANRRRRRVACLGAAAALALGPVGLVLGQRPLSAVIVAGVVAARDALSILGLAGRAGLHQLL